MDVIYLSFLKAFQFQNRQMKFRDFEVMEQLATLQTGFRKESGD